MAFVAGRLITLGAAGAAPLPAATDVGGASPSFTLYSHMRIPAASTITFDSGQVYAATGDTVIAIPPNANSFTSSGAVTVQLGQSN